MGGAGVPGKNIKKPADVGKKLPQELINDAYNGSRLSRSPRRSRRCGARASSALAVITAKEKAKANREREDHKVVNTMRRFLNLNQLSTIFLKLIGFFVVLVPVVLYVILLAWSEPGTITTLLLSLMKASFAVGALIFVVFLVLIVVEQIQDHDYDVRYQKQRSQKVLLANGYYECQYCGNRKVREAEKSCSVCGKEFEFVKSK